MKAAMWRAAASGYLVMRRMAGLREGNQLQGRKLLIQGVPVLHRERDVVIAADVQDGHLGMLHGQQNRIGRKQRGSWLRRQRHWNDRPAGVSLPPQTRSGYCCSWDSVCSSFQCPFG